MSKKSSTPRPSAASKRAELRRKLARDLAAVMSNPETPATLYNAIGDELCEMSEAISFHTFEMIERSITAHIVKEEKRKGGKG